MAYDALNIYLGQQVQQRRTDYRWRVEDLARESDLKIARIMHIEAGRARPTSDELVRLCEALQVEILEMFGRTLRDRQ